MSEKHKDVIEERLFVRRPTEDDEVEYKLGDPVPQPDLLVDDADLMKMAPDQATGMMASVKRWYWDEGDNPVKLVEEFILSMRCGIYPSEMALKWLAAGLETWHDNQGKRNLEQCLGLKKGAGHAANMMKEANRQAVHEHLMTLMRELRYGLGLEVKDCQEILTGWMESDEWYTGSHRFKPLSEDTLEALWKSASWARDKEAAARIRERYMTKESRQELIEKFPRHCWQHIPELAEYL